MGSIGEYDATDVPGGQHISGNDLDHHDPLTDREEEGQGPWTGGGNIEDDHNYHEHPPQNVHISL